MFPGIKKTKLDREEIIIIISRLKSISKLMIAVGGMTMICFATEVIIKKMGRDNKQHSGYQDPYFMLFIKLF